MPILYVIDSVYVIVDISLIFLPFLSRLEKQMEKYVTLKKHAEEKIDLANKTIGEERKAAESEQTRLKASHKLLDIKASKLQKQVEDKTKENEELTAICDELLSKVGSAWFRAPILVFMEGDPHYFSVLFRKFCTIKAA